MNKQTAQLLEQHFDIAFAAPDGIKKLRELILTLTMQGKLVEQDPNDPPASELLRQIEKERISHEGTKTRRKDKELPPIKPDEVPYELPQGWEWVRLGEAMLKITDGTHHSPPNNEKGDFLYISAKNIKDDGVLISNATYVTEEVHDEIFSRCDPEYGNILYIKDGATTGIVTINDLKEPFSMLSSVALLKQPHQVDNRYLLFTLRSPFFYGEMRAGMTGVAITRVTLKKLHDAIIPLPPLSEQHRIVARIDQLMARCDELEKLRKEREEKRLAVHAAAIKQLLDSNFASSRLRVSQDSSSLRAFVPSCETGGAFDFLAKHFGELYTVKENVAELRKAILQLAVMGRLVPQDPNDPPASELLREIEKEKVSREGAKTRRKETKLPPIKPEKVPYQLPKGWEWVRLGDAGAFERGRSKHRPRNDKRLFEHGTYPFVQTGDVSRSKATENQIMTCTSYYNDFGLKQSRLWEKGTLCITIAANIAETGFLGMDACIPDSVVAFLGVNKSLEKLVKVFIDVAKGDLEHFAPSTAQKNINLGIINELLFPLPPLNEQHRIVARIDQLMALCDTLEQRIDAATVKRTELLGAVMATI
ncbi:restriction endonuclease subunit S [Pelobacter propionicus]|uniref:Restriction modification system DNA specificity domain protein n=1 Tax=Pelobacter propionicus (strain DSM 2379 / NBRC 103807 / OttBd1) TaxID=338966 RepID=A1AKW9_PELPD|nr:restriction endonuclease subunit S [Pelobacter propionicus]ABK97989.1 restriction modification system DNA specificity domain protein [Pelobacter propionicus DSM 2379]